MIARFPKKITLLAAFITVSTIAVVMLMFYNYYQNAIANEERSSALQALSADIILFDEQRTSSALLAAYSGDRQWVRRYNAVKADLTRAFDNTLALSSSTAVHDAAKSTEDANTILVEIETKAINAIESGDKKTAISLLNAHQYVFQKNRYGSGMASMLKLITNQRQQEYEAIHNRFRNVVLGVIASLGLVAFLWLMVYRVIDKWRLRLNSEILKREQAENRIRAMNAELELRVEERTEELQQTQDKLTHQANYDELTGLPNRRFVLNHLSEVIPDACEKNQIVVMLVDLDYFKQVNDTLGHAAGDELLQQAAQRLKQAVGSGNIVARLGGDEFLAVSQVAAEGICEKKKTDIANQILQQFKTPFILGGRTYNLPISPSIGIAVVPDDGTSVEQIMQNADTAMYAAKDQGRNNACFYRPEMYLQNKDSVMMESKLRSAISTKDQFQLYYQPQIDLANNQVVGVEALLRWIQPEDGLILPDQFIPLAEDTGLILEIGHWVLFEAARQTREWQDNHDFNLNVSINVASQQLTQKNFFNTVEQAFQEHGISSDCIGIEITESSLIGCDSISNQNINSLSEYGVKLSLDDFGTGYSALSYLKQYPFDYLKIDRSFIATILEGNSNAALVEGIINMSHNINLKVVGEGTETLQQCELLRQFGCDIAQGYYYSNPLPSHELVKFMQIWEKPEVQDLLRKAS